MTAEVDEREARPRVETCVLCGEHFDSFESLDEHLVPSPGTVLPRCRDPWTITVPGRRPGRFDYLFERKTAWSWPPFSYRSLNDDPTLEDR